MRRLIKNILMIALFFACGCGNSFYQAQDYFTGPVSGVGLKKSTTIASGGTEQLSAVVVPSKTANKNVTWTSSDPTIASVDANGLVTGVINVAHGFSYQATITVTTEEGGFTAQCLVTVVEKPVPVTGVTLNKSSGSLYYASSSDYSTDQLTATITPSTATNQNITWSSDDSTIASVNNSGLVTPNRVGITKIRVTSADGGYSASCTYTVAAAQVPVTAVALNTSATTIVAGDTETLFAYITPVNATNQTVFWASSNTGAATVDQLGNVTGVAAGTATVTATTTDGTSLSASATVTVVATAVPVTGVSLSRTSATVTVGDSLTLTATISPAGATNRNLQWSSTNTGVASVSSSGVVTGIAAGSATVKVTTVDGGFTASCIVTVTNDPTYKIIYDGNGATGGSVPVDSSGYVPGSTVIIMNNGTLTRTSYTFNGWNTVSNGTGTPYSAGSTLAMGSGDITLYAQWTLASTNTYTLTYDGNFKTGGTVPAVVGPYAENTVITLAGQGDLSKTGFAFGGWYINSGTTYAADGSFTMPAYNVTMLAKWLPVHRIIYVGNGNGDGTVPVDSNSYIEGATATLLTNSGDLSKTGYNFAGWYNSPGNYYYTGQSFTTGSSDTILYANWSNSMSVFTSPTVSNTINISASCTVIVKAWGAGGQFGQDGNGGGGGFSYSVFTAIAGDVIHVVVGAGGGNTYDSSMPALGGRNGHIGGGGSLVALLRGTTYTLKCCAGGGGGGGSGINAGAGGGPAGENEAWNNSTGGSNGNGGSGTYPGSSMSLTTTTGIGLGGLGGNGGAGGGQEGGAGGGGYGGGGTSGWSLLCYAGSGGGGYCTGSTGITITGSGVTPANSTDPDLPGGQANGGYLDISSNIIPAGDGYVVVYIINN